MGLGILTDKNGYSCLYDTTKMKAFGGIFYSTEDPKDFIEWMHPVDPCTLTDDELDDKIEEYRNELIA